MDGGQKITNVPMRWDKFSKRRVVRMIEYMQSESRKGNNGGKHVQQGWEPGEGGEEPTAEGAVHRIHPDQNYSFR